jgi:predicted RNase H-like nuclease (RuvC/YqgF family)
VTHSPCKCRVVFLNDPNEVQEPVVVFCEYHKGLEAEVERLQADNEILLRQVHESVDEVERLKATTREHDLCVRCSIHAPVSEVERLTAENAIYAKDQDILVRRWNETVPPLKKEVEQLRAALEKIRVLYEPTDMAWAVADAALAKDKIPWDDPAGDPYE